MFIFKLGAGLGVMAFAAMGVLALPGFAPDVEASLNPAANKNARLDIRGPVPECLNEPWPYGCHWRASMDNGCLNQPWPYGCDWRASADTGAKRVVATERNGGAKQVQRFQYRRVHGVLTKFRVARRDAQRVQ